MDHEEQQEVSKEAIVAAVETLVENWWRCLGLLFHYLSD